MLIQTVLEKYNGNKKPTQFTKFPFGKTLIMMAVMLLVQFLILKPLTGKTAEIPYSQFKQEVAAGNVWQVEIGEKNRFPYAIRDIRQSNLSPSTRYPCIPVSDLDP